MFLTAYSIFLYTYRCDVLVKELERKNQDLHEGEKNRHEIELKLSSALKHFEEAKKK